MFPVAKSICESSRTFYDLILVDMDLRCWLSILSVGSKEEYYKEHSLKSNNSFKIWRRQLHF